MRNKPVDEMTPEELAAEYTLIGGGKAVYSGNGWIAYWACRLSPGCKVSYRVKDFRRKLALKREKIEKRGNPERILSI